MPKHKVGSTVTFKNGAKAKVMPSGRLRIFKGPTKSTRKKKGGSVRVGGSIGVGGSVGIGGSMRKRKKKGGSVRVGGSMSIAGSVNRKY